MGSLRALRKVEGEIETEGDVTGGTADKARDLGLVSYRGLSV